MRIKFWRITRATAKGQVIPIARILGVTWGDKTIEEFTKELELKHRQFCDELILARWF